MNFTQCWIIISFSVSSLKIARNTVDPVRCFQTKKFTLYSLSFGRWSIQTQAFISCQLTEVFITFFDERARVCFELFFGIVWIFTDLESYLLIIVNLICTIFVCLKLIVSYQVGCFFSWINSEISCRSI